MAKSKLKPSRLTRRGLFGFLLGGAALAALPPVRMGGSLLGPGFAAAMRPGDVFTLAGVNGQFRVVSVHSGRVDYV